MMDTILNLGINDAIAEGLAEEMGELPWTLVAAFYRYTRMCSWR